MAANARPTSQDQGGKAKLIAAAVASLSIACGSSAPPQKTQADVETIRREQTPDNLLARGKAFEAVGDHGRAEQYFAMAIEAGADEMQVMPLLVRACVQDGRYRVAIEYCEAHLKKHPHDASTRFVLGTIYSAVGEPSAARDALERVLDTHPNDPRAHYALAVVMRDGVGDRVGADKHFREYLRLDPKGKHAEEARASLLEEVPR